MCQGDWCEQRPSGWCRSWRKEWRNSSKPGMRGGQRCWPTGSSMQGVCGMPTSLGLNPVDSTLAFLHGHCNKGKQQQLRGGFDFAIPANFRTGFAWAQHMLDIWKRFPTSKQRTSDYCFNAEGKPWAIKEVQDVMQAELAAGVDNATEMSTYGWRRTGPLQMKPEEMAALGDWQTQSDIPNVANMPLHYSSAKYAASLRVKAIPRDWCFLPVGKTCTLQERPNRRACQWPRSCCGRTASRSGQPLRTLLMCRRG